MSWCAQPALSHTLSEPALCMSALVAAMHCGCSNIAVSVTPSIGATYSSVCICIFTSDCILGFEITHRVIAAYSAFQQLRLATIWSSRALTLSVKMQCLFQCNVVSVLLYCGETWPAVNTPALGLLSRRTACNACVAYPCMTMCHMLSY